MIAPARRISYRILLEVDTTDAHSDELLRTPEVDRLSGPDRNLATTLVLGTLRWQLALDARIRSFLARPNATLAPEVATAMRMGAFQLLHLERVPAHAVINDSVELVKQSAERGAAGMVNAILRKIAAGPPDPYSARPSSAQQIASALAHPEWMVERWAQRYGVSAAEAICRWDQEPAGNSIRLTDPEADLSSLNLAPGIFLTNARRVLQGDIGRSEPLRTGRIRIQDEASQLVAEIAAAAAPQAEAVLDTCAAPGGKTAVLAERLPRAEITAVDVSRKRLESMRRLSGNGGGRLHLRAADAASLNLKPEFDLILCDVPCSGTGTMARNPEIRLRVQQADLARQHTRQAAILRAGLAGLTPGGRLVYSTCSLEPEENEAVVREVIGREVSGRAVGGGTSGLRLIPAGDLLDHLAQTGIVTETGRELLRSAEDGPFLRTVPGLQPCDGFFAAVIQRD